MASLGSITLQGHATLVAGLLQFVDNFHHRRRLRYLLLADAQLLRDDPPGLAFFNRFRPYGRNRSGLMVTALSITASILLPLLRALSFNLQHDRGFTPKLLIGFLALAVAFDQCLQDVEIERRRCLGNTMPRGLNFLIK